MGRNIYAAQPGLSIPNLGSVVAKACFAAGRIRFRARLGGDRGASLTPFSDSAYEQANASLSTVIAWRFYGAVRNSELRESAQSDHHACMSCQ